ncbi:hypothetical protein SAMN05443634_105165 [Chishuiella changwenlii]|uniref:Uncharacterized protein n=1 Tax=Chishuiella changwenlii TaxID=1434701 RepID=A0A1M6X9E4_9FLAO|nr:hypothetical protein [Chishuiella changwenlii]GGF00184.1 hypothetical protein GCM10010984_17190 [Chishuiella changwenlii]SHL02581.1 hypothetical protein SAMN05443634_105165 [Chishuiella changwenlii]
MKQKLLELLNAKFLGKGTRKDTLERLASAYTVQVTTEEEASALVEKITQEQVTNFEKEYRSDVDSEISKATKTALEKAAKGKEEDEPELNTEGGEGNPNPTDIATIIANAVAKATNPLMEEITAIKSGKTSETRLSQINDILKDAKDETLKNTISKNFGRMSFESDDSFAEYLTEIQADVTTSNQTITNQGLSNHRPGAGGAGNGGKLSDAEYDAMV